jgi:hypothetical protein
MSKHTPGPWHWDDGEVKDDMPRLMSPSGTVCHFGRFIEYYPYEGDPPSDADARLIASAPDLLSVCKELAASAAYWGDYDVPLGIVDRLNAAIAKAEGI